MWVFILVFLLSRLFRMAKRLKEYKDLHEQPGVVELRKDSGDKVNCDDEEDFESQELKMLRIEEQKIKNVIAEEKLALDRQKRVQSKAMHEVKIKKIAKEYMEELKEPATWFSQ